MPILANQMSNLNNSPSDLETESFKELARILKKSNGRLKISFNRKPSFVISLDGNIIRLDVEDPSFFDNISLGTEAGGFRFSNLFDKLKTTQKLAEILNDCGLSLIVLRKGKEAFTLGRDATPTISSVLTGSDDIHIDNVAETAKLGKYLAV